jgi:hypothetical protein
MVPGWIADEELPIFLNALRLLIVPTNVRGSALVYGNDAKQKSFLVFAEHTAALTHELVSERGTRAQPASRDCRMVATLQKIAVPA